MFGSAWRLIFTFMLFAGIGISVLCTAINCTPADVGGDEVSGVDAVNKRTVFNVLILGLDKSERLSDVIMLASADFVTGQITVAQIPRDTYAEYTSSAYRKLNGAISSLGGGRAVADFLENVFSITVDYYVTVDLDTLVKVVDMLGGVDVNIPKDMFYEDERIERLIPEYEDAVLRGDLESFSAATVI